MLAARPAPGRHPSTSDTTIAKAAHGRHPRAVRGPRGARRAEVLVLVAHPQLEQSRVNRRMLRQRRAAAGRAAPGAIEVRDLYALYPDYLIDVAAEQAALARGEAGRLAAPDPLVRHAAADEALGRRGARLRLGLRARRHRAAGQGPLARRPRTGGPEDSYRPDSYNRYFFDAFLPPYEQTAALCGMRFLPPLLLHGAHRAGEAELAAARRASTPSGSPTLPATGPRLDESLDGLPRQCDGAARRRGRPTSRRGSG